MRKPTILAYILTGILLGPVGLFHLQHEESLKAFGQLGITFLLFMLGLELKLHELRSIGKNALIVGTLQVVITFILGYGLALLLGLGNTPAFYLGIGLAFSSTIIIIKLFSDRKDLNSLHGKITLGILLVQDFFAVLAIIFLTGLQSSGNTNLLFEGLFVLLKLGVLIGWIIVVSLYVFPKILPKIARSKEALFLFSLSWVFFLTALVSAPFVGFSIEIGGFLAGIALANSQENFHIVSKMKALRDFFITIFFVILGLEMSFDNILSVIGPAVLLILFVLFIKPLVLMLITSLVGFRKRTSFLVGSSMAQISEFSLIILFLGNQQRVVPNEMITLMVIVGAATFVGSTYIIQGSNKLYTRLSPHLNFLNFPHVSEIKQENDEKKDLKNHVVVVGAHQMGQSIINSLEDSGEEVLVVDFDPDKVSMLRAKNINIIFGDIADPDIQERVGLESAKLVISTVPDVEDNLLLIEGMNHMNKRALIVVMALDTDDAKTLYKAGADYVVLPHLAGGRHLAKILIDKKHMEMIEDYKAKDLTSLSQ